MMLTEKELIQGQIDATTVRLKEGYQLVTEVPIPGTKEKAWITRYIRPSEVYGCGCRVCYFRVDGPMRHYVIGYEVHGTTWAEAFAQALKQGKEAIAQLKG